MAGGVVVNSGGGKDYPGKLTMFVLFACIVAATGGLIFGYDIGISGKLRIPARHSAHVLLFEKKKNPWS
jgi:hypothetical protein